MSHWTCELYHNFYQLNQKILSSNKSIDHLIKECGKSKCFKFTKHSDCSFTLSFLDKVHIKYKKGGCGWIYECESFEQSVDTQYPHICPLCEERGIIRWEPLRVTRDEHQIPTIHGGSISQIYEELGFLHTTDRPWLQFTALLQGNGLLSAYFGPGFIDDDEMTLRLVPSPEEINRQIECFSLLGRTIVASYTRGVNRAYQEMQAEGLPPAFIASAITSIPEFTLTQLLSSIYYFSSTLSSAFSGYRAQIQNFYRYIGLLNQGYGTEDILRILGDIRNLQNTSGSKIKECFTVTDDPVFGSKCDSKREGNLIPYHSKKGCDVSKVNFTGLQGRLEKQGRLNTLKREKNCVCHNGDEIRLASFGLVAHGKLTASGLPILSGNSQGGQTTPATDYRYNIVNSRFQWHADGVPTIPVIPIGTFVIGNFGVSLTTQVTNVPGRDAMLLPASELGDPIRTVTLNVRGMGPYDVPIYRSPVPGRVTEPYFLDIEGVRYAMVQRSPFVGRELFVFDAVVNSYFQQSLEDFTSILTSSDKLTDSYLECTIGYDLEGNIFATQVGAWADLPGYNRMLPQGMSLDGKVITPIVPLSAYKLRKGAYEINPKKSYFIHWNNSFAQKQPSIFVQGEYARVAWLESYIQCILKQRLLVYEDMHSLLLHAGNARGFNGDNRMNYASNPWLMFRDLLLKQVNDLRPDVVKRLSRYNGAAFGETRDEIVNGEYFLPDWILTMSWFYKLQRALLAPVIGDAILPPDTPSWTSGQDQLIPILARIMGVSSCKSCNPVYYGGWLRGINLRDTIRTTFQEAIAEQPQLPVEVQTFLYAFLGFPVTTSKAINRGNIYITSRLECLVNGNALIHTESINPLGQREAFILTSAGLIALPDTTLYQRAFESFNLQQMAPMPSWAYMKPCLC